MERTTSLFALLRAHFPQEVVIKSFRRNEHLLRAGAVEKYLYHILSGAVRVVYPTEHGDLNIRFGYAHSVLASIPSIFDGNPSLFSIEALRKTRVACIPRHTYLNAINEIAEVNTAHGYILENLVKQQIEREIDLLTPSPSERHMRVTARSPNLFQEVPLYHIANYLRMTPETLSRLRNS